MLMLRTALKRKKLQTEKKAVSAIPSGLKM
jgi:hypothetical protein